MYIMDEFELRNSRSASLFEDNRGVFLTADELNELSVWEIEERQIRVSEL